MRILHIDSGRHVGGGQWQVLRLMLGLRDRDCDCILATPAANPLAKVAADEGLRVIKRTSRLPDADLVHVHDARSHITAALFARVPVIVARRVAFPIKQGWLSRWKYGRATHFIAVSQYVAGMLTQAGIPPARISTVYDGVPLLPLSTCKGGVLELEKNTSNLEEALRDARMLVYLSKAEGLGSGALLGMSAGIPVIASRVGGLPEAIDHGVNGLLVSVGSGEVAESIRRLVANPVESARLGANARRTIEERFTVERMVEDTLSVYKKVLDA